MCSRLLILLILQMASANEQASSLRSSRALQTTSAPTGSPSTTVPTTAPTAQPVDIAEKIQNEFTDALPEINFDMRAAFEDPVELNLTASVPLGCGTLLLNMEFERLTGLSTVNVTELTVTQGTDSSNEDWDLLVVQTWKTAADIVVDFENALVSGQVRSSLTGRCNGVIYDQPLTTKVEATGVGFKGRANVDGRFGPITDQINTVDVLGLLELETDSIEATIGLFPPTLEPWFSTTKSQLEAAFRQQIVQHLEPAVREELEIIIPTNPIRSVLRQSTSLLENVLNFVVDILNNLG